MFVAHKSCALVFKGGSGCDLCNRRFAWGFWSVFSAKALRKLKKGDTLICCGDFGFLWEGGKAEERALKKIGRFPFTTLFVDGAHENHEALQALR